MAIVKNGSLTVVSGGTAQNLNLGFIPTHFTMYNLTTNARYPNGQHRFKHSGSR